MFVLFAIILKQTTTGLQNWSKIVSKAIDQRVGGIVVSIAAFQAVDPGSIPSRRSFLLPYFFVLQSVNFFYDLKADRIPLSFMLRSSANVSEKEHI